MTSGPLISPEELRGVLTDVPVLDVPVLDVPVLDVTVLDVRYKLGGPPGIEEFRRGHVPGSAYVDLDVDLAAPPGDGGRHPLPDPAHFEAAMRRVGVSDGRPVVVLDDWSGLAAGRLWWLLRFHGHADVRLLDGALAGWTAIGGALETGDTTTEPGDFTARPGAMPMVDADSARSVDVLVDARAPERYRGEQEPIDPVAGHIPGAVNVPTARNLGPDGRFRSPAELAEVYAAVGAVPGVSVAAYCGSGVTALHDVIALELTGVRAALYPGSWSDWLRDPARPQATGEEPTPAG